MDEGSVEVDGLDSVNETEQDTTENINNQVETSQENEGEGESVSEPQESSNDQTDQKETTETVDAKKEDAQKTEKGTKLADDPLSRANQLRANAEKQARDYMQLLNDPDRLETYLQELREERGVQTQSKQKSEENTVSFDELNPEKLETKEDLIKFAKGLKEATRREIDFVKKSVSGISAEKQQEKLYGSIQNSISELQNKYPVLREFNADGAPNPDYNPELDELIGSTYQELDLDTKTGRYNGRVNIISLADKIMKAKGIGEGTGSRKAKTEVIDKSRGRVIGSIASSGGNQLDDTKLSPSATIAERMKRAAKRR